MSLPLQSCSILAYYDLLRKPQQSQNQQMGRIKNIKEPLGKASVLFRPLSIVQINDTNCGEENSTDSTKRTQDT